MRCVKGVVATLVMIGVLAGCSSPRQAAPGVRVYEHGVVAADHAVASRAGADMLLEGGNAVDAAVATSFALSVVRPYSCGIGGGGFMVIHLPADPTHGEVTTALNYRETAPGRVDASFFADGQRSSLHGGTAIGVPGTVAGLLYALETYGTMSRAEVLAPAIRAAEEGFEADAHYVNSTRALVDRFRSSPVDQQRFSLVWLSYLQAGNVRVGETIRSYGQARALRLIAQQGADVFYRGEIGDAIVAAVSQDRGVLSRTDLANYRVREVEPLRFSFYDYDLLAMPPPSSGGVAMAEALGLLERTMLREQAQGIESGGMAYEMARTAECLKHAFADRAEWMGDPDYVDVPVDDLLDAQRLDALAEWVQPGRVWELHDYGSRSQFVPDAPPDDAGTSHFSVVDRWGGAVACTETINTTFGSLVGVTQYGFVLNNEMDDFTARPDRPNTYGLIQSSRNAPAPGKRPLSSMSPTIVLDEQGVYAVAGGSGGPRIISGTLQVLLVAMGAAGQDLDSAGGLAALSVGMWRMHHQWIPDLLRIERSVWTSAAMQEELDDGRTIAEAYLFEPLEGMGYEIQPIESVGTIQLIVRDAGGWQAASDPRKGGVPSGY